MSQETLGLFLGLIEKDISAGCNVSELPPRLLAEMRRAMREVAVDLDEELDVGER